MVEKQLNFLLKMISDLQIYNYLLGAVKDSGVLFLLNKFIADKTGKAPFEKF